MQRCGSVKNSVTDTTDFGCSERMPKKTNSGISHMSEQFLLFKYSSKDVLYAKHHTFVHLFVFYYIDHPIQRLKSKMHNESVTLDIRS